MAVHSTHIDDDCEECGMMTAPTYLGHPTSYWLDMAATVYLPWISIFLILVLLGRIINRKAHRRYREALERQKETYEQLKTANAQSHDAIERQKEMLNVLKEISQKLDKK